jgi:hypothetical protein
MLSEDIEIVDQVMDAPWMQRGPSYHSWQRIKTALVEARFTTHPSSTPCPACDSTDTAVVRVEARECNACGTRWPVE